MIAKNYKLQDFLLEPRSSSNQALLLVFGWTGYQDILKNTYGTMCKTPFESKNQNYQWGVFIDCHDDQEYEQLESFLKMLQNVVCIKDNLNQSFALGYHFHSSFEGEGRTKVGELVHRAKPYSRNVRSEHKEHADVLAIWFTSFFRRHSAYLASDYLLAVPPKHGKGFDLPTYVVEKVCQELNIENGCSFVSKRGDTISQKDIIDIEKRAENIQNAFVLSSSHPFNGKLVTIIDDIYDTGSTINELGKVLQTAGATVYALTATRVNRRSYDIP